MLGFTFPTSESQEINMEQLEYTLRIIQLGEETAKGNPKAYDVAFGDYLEHDCHASPSDGCDHPSHKDI